MAADISNTINHQKDIDVLNSLVTDLATVRTALNAVVTKLNADAGVTDTDYAACAALGTTI